MVSREMGGCPVTWSTGLVLAIARVGTSLDQERRRGTGSERQD